ncbi:hypothetical protein STSP2_01564 [Anaerohalosphaera lusitana]|uniref:Uncharacterized protein n=1 Tax=Anaerohalosphaera lusitana TaxID=1936003 RepID=A0A1U9NL05_9BACT|nr:hypothetical protein [Anaerohalosphaera lusitana]AQT68404.1 hypothetical protein STSP2_01564 [Anaerohalosphaera lusitana]
MTRTQILAKALLAVLGVHAFFYLFFKAFDYIRLASRYSASAVIASAILLLLFWLILVYLVFRNNRLAAILPGPAPDDPPATTLFTVLTFRTAFVAYGLILIGKNARHFLGILSFLFPSRIRDYINQIITGSTDLADVLTIYTLYPLGYLVLFILSIYFITGAPHLVRFYTRQIASFASQKPKPSGVSENE